MAYILIYEDSNSYRILRLNILSSESEKMLTNVTYFSSFLAQFFQRLFRTGTTLFGQLTSIYGKKSEGTRKDELMALSTNFYLFEKNCSLSDVIGSIPAVSQELHLIFFNLPWDPIKISTTQACSNMHLQLDSQVHVGNYLSPKTN